MRNATILFTSIFAVPQPIFAGAAANLDRAWTPSNGVQVTYIATSQERPEQISDLGPSAVVPSPDGKFFFFVSHRGDLTLDKNVYELHVYETAAVKRALSSGRALSAEGGLSPMWRVQRPSSSSVRPGISSAKWDPQSRAVFFFDLDDRDLLQVNRLDIATGQVSRRTHHDQLITGFQASGECMLFQDVVKYQPPQWRYPIEPVERDGSGNAVIPISQTYLKGSRTAYTTCVGAPPRPLSEGLAPNQALWFAPSAPLAVALSAKWPSAFVLVDLNRAQVEPLLSVPTGTVVPSLTDKGRKLARSGHALPQPTALWFDDNRQVILVNTTLPGEDAPKDPAVLPERYIVRFDLQSRKWWVVERMVEVEPGEGSIRYVSDVGWLKPGKLLVTHARDESPTESSVYTFSGDKIVHRPAAANLRLPSVKTQGVSVRLEQSSNDPPVVVAESGAEKLRLTPADPMLAGVARAPMQPFQWTAPDGAVLTGGLTLPHGATGPVPLVIQVNRYRPGIFLPDGPIPGPDATQTFVARGIAVLDMGILAEVPNEGPIFVGRVDAAVDALAAKGWIDRTRVGLTGFSRGGYQTYYAATHPGRTPFAAIVCADSFTGSYMSYLFDAVDNGAQGLKVYEATPGGSFWESKKLWLENETTFNVDRVRMPILFTSHGKESDPMTPYVQETLGAFNRTKRPFEYLMLGSSGHQPQRPREQQALMEAVVDWMAFWLKDEVPSDHALADRWTKTRADWKRQQAWEDAGHPVASEPNPSFNP